MSDDERGANLVDPRTGTDTRDEPPPLVGERETLVAFLKWQRQTFEIKCTGLDAEAMARRSVEPSSMSLLGLLRHMADVERSWFRNVLSGSGTPPYFFSEDDRNGEFEGAKADPELVEEAWRVWRGEVAFAETFAEEAESLDVTGEEAWRGPMSLRWVLVHMIEEYARHIGHADLLRERVDGAVGQ
jgi:uncharacterized damage-inducible protein DinB